MPNAGTAAKAAEKAQQALISRRRGPPVSNETLVGAAIFGCVATGMLGLLSRRHARRREQENPAERCADGLKEGAVLLAASVLLDSAFEHFRGNYRNRAMYLAPTAAAISMAASLTGRAPRPLRTGIFAAAGAIGLAGLSFHAYNIFKRPGGLSWNNLFYAAPALAPGALAFSGFLGYAANHLEHAWETIGSAHTRREIGPTLGILMAGGILSTASEAALLHFRGAYHDPFMYLPVTVPPVAAATLVAASLKPTDTRLRLARLALRATALIGLLGSAFHVYGVGRNMGGWRNWTQNLFVGPPIPAPPSFTGLAVGGLGILQLLKRKDSSKR